MLDNLLRTDYVDTEKKRIDNSIRVFSLEDRCFYNSYSDTLAHLQMCRRGTAFYLRILQHAKSLTLAFYHCISIMYWARMLRF